MTQWFPASKRFATSLASAALLAIGAWIPPVVAEDPFRTENVHDIGDRTEAAFRAMFEQGNYTNARALVETAIADEPDEPMAYAMKASLEYHDKDWEEFSRYATRTRETAERLSPDDPFRASLYTAVGHFLEGAYILKNEGEVRGTPKALSKLRQVFEYLDTAENLKPNDPELNLIKGYMDLMLAVNLPFSNPDRAIGRLRDHAAPRFLAYRGLAVGYRDLERHEEAMRMVDRALELTPDNPELHYLKAQIFVEQDREPDSIEWFEKALEKADQLPKRMVRQIRREYGQAKD